MPKGFVIGTGKKPPYIVYGQKPNESVEDTGLYLVAFHAAPHLLFMGGSGPQRVQPKYSAQFKGSLEQMAAECERRRDVPRLVELPDEIINVGEIAVSDMPASIGKGLYSMLLSKKKLWD